MHEENPAGVINAVITTEWGVAGGGGVRAGGGLKLIAGASAGDARGERRPVA